MAAAQESVMPGGMTVVSCPAPFGGGGLGRHLKEIVEALARRGQPHTYIGESVEHAPAPVRRELAPRALAAALAPAGRVSAAWRIWSASVAFDAFAAERLPAAESLLAFNGTALRQLELAPQLGYGSICLVSANSHFRRVIRQHALAHRRYPLERPWVRRLLRRNLAEYQRVQRIYVASRYVWESFLEEGFAEERLALFPLTPEPRFAPAAEPAEAQPTFNIIYVGSLTVHKGVPLLIEAFRRLAHPDMRLTLIGGWKSRPMRQFIQRACAEDGRIEVRPGDPLPRLRAASLCVHAAYEDGFAYAPAEALAAGVPVIVSQDTGMKDLIDSPQHGLVLETGNLDALTDSIDAAYRRELFGG